MFKNSHKFSRYTWFTLAYTILVVLFGAFVRATGSGAGCGSHWPLCNGVIIPRPERVETIIEFTHRITSGGMLILALILIIWAWKEFPAGNILRKTTGLVGFFALTEALVGAGLVLFGLVEDNDSIARAISMVVHLINTFLLLAFIALTGWWATYGIPVKLRMNGIYGLLVIAGCIGILILGASGAITALGDTLFPSTSLAEGLQSDFSSSSHFLVRLRIYHPGIAIATGLLLFTVTLLIRRKNQDLLVHRLSSVLIIFYTVQFLIGIVNVVLLAPVWIQILHLLTSNLIWICFIFLTGEVFGNFSSGLVHQEINKPIDEFPG